MPSAPPIAWKDPRVLSVAAAACFLVGSFLPVVTISVALLGVTQSGGITANTLVGGFHWLVLLAFLGTAGARFAAAHPYQRHADMAVLGLFVLWVVLGVSNVDNVAQVNAVFGGTQPMFRLSPGLGVPFLVAAPILLGVALARGSAAPSASDAGGLDLSGVGERVGGVVRQVMAAMPRAAAPAAPPEPASKAPAARNVDATATVVPGAERSGDDAGGRPFLTVVPADGGPARRVPLDYAETTIGRSTDCGVAVEDQKASRKHAVVRYDGTAFRISDAGSSNGTTVNGQPATDERELAFGDRIQVGTTVLTFSCAGHELRETDPAAALAAFRRMLERAPDFALAAEAAGELERHDPDRTVLMH
ncbi:FHA domain-containing protein [Azospirillum sp. RWY-5-1]|uniref:FHA domain-containing protein n=1 Tax=Azospirillum oleiclasticum TaxID=2735135 RepID=A0ABX2T9R7_9PROT|nr:FHA domain-containing protein [Azospirillum oleiclasticum]NYZ12733.1 FHA domain-containing protein [Azospirillum oleiclasticum]NYZ19893.1 FHA domain-containing protein [Azospirillum oleiclasticum]